MSLLQMTFRYYYQIFHTKKVHQYSIQFVNIEIFLFTNHIQQNILQEVTYFREVLSDILNT